MAMLVVSAISAVVVRKYSARLRAQVLRARAPPPPPSPPNLGKGGEEEEMV